MPQRPVFCTGNRCIAAPCTHHWLTEQRVQLELISEPAHLLQLLSSRLRRTAHSALGLQQSGGFLKNCSGSRHLPGMAAAVERWLSCGGHHALHVQLNIRSPQLAPYSRSQDSLPAHIKTFAVNHRTIQHHPALTCSYVSPALSAAVRAAPSISSPARQHGCIGGSLNCQLTRHALHVTLFAPPPLVWAAQSDPKHQRNSPPAARMPPTAESRASVALVSVAAGMCSTFSLQGREIRAGIRLHQ